MPPSGVVGFCKRRAAPSPTRAVASGTITGQDSTGDGREAGTIATSIPELKFCGVKQSSTSRAAKRRIAVAITLCCGWL
jgi:hypothetical protein